MDDAMERTAVLVLKGAISEMPAKKQADVKLAADEFRATLKKYGDAGMYAMALVGQEIGSS